MNIGGWIPAICPSCNATLSVTNDGRHAHCPYCGSEFLPNEGIAKFSATYMTNYVTTNTAYFGSEEKDFSIVAGTLIKYSGAGVDIIIPNNVETIGTGAFKNQGIHSVSIPTSVTKIERDAFSGCRKLTRVDMQKVKHIEDRAFDGCCNLAEIDLPAELRYIGTDAFRNTMFLNKVSIGHYTKIGDYAFENTRLKKVHIDKPVDTFFEEYRSNLPFFETLIEEIRFSDFTLDLATLQWEYNFHNIDEYQIFRNFFRNTPFVEVMERRIDRCFEKGVCPICRSRTILGSEGGPFTGMKRRTFKKCPKCGVEMERKNFSFYDGDPRYSYCDSDE